MATKKLPLDVQASADQQIQGLTSQIMGGDLSTGPSQNMAYPAPLIDVSNARLEREKNTTNRDYLGAMWDQDNLVSGLIGHFVGQNMRAEEGYSFATDPEFKAAQKEVWPEFQKELYDAKSGAHFQYLKSRLIDKQNDLTKLGDLGWKGTAGRFALGFADPAALLSGYSAGIGYRTMQAYRGSRAAAAVRATTAEQGLVRGAAVAAEATAAEASIGGSFKVAAGAALSAGGQNAAYEKIRQSVNFEDSTAEVIGAGLFGIALSAPFIAAGARSQRRVARAAAKDRDALNAVADLHDGRDITDGQKQLLVDTYATASKINNIEMGKLPPDEIITMDFDYLLKHGLVEPDEAYARYLAQREKLGLPNAADETIELGGTARKPVITSDATQPSAKGLEVVEGEFDAPTTKGMEVTEGTMESAEGTSVPRPLTTRGLEVTEGDPFVQAGPKTRWDTVGGESFASQLDNAKAALESITAARAKRDAEIGDLLRRKMTKDDKFAQAEADAAATKEAELSAIQNAQELLRAHADLKESGFVMPQNAAAIAALATLVAALTAAPSDAEAAPKLRVNMFGKVADVAANVAPVTAQDAALNTSRMNRKLVTFSKDGKEFSVPSRWDFFATLNRSENPEVRKLTADLIKDAIGHDDNIAQPMTASEIKSDLRRTIMGSFLADANTARRDATKVAGDNSTAFTDNFYSLVSKVGRGDDTVLDGLAYAPQVRAAAAAQQKMYGRFLQEMKDAGVKGADEVNPNDMFVNRVWKHDSIREAKNQFGEAMVVQLIANSIKGAGNGDTARAAKFLKAVERLEHSAALRDMHLAGRDLVNLRSELAKSKLTQAEIDSVIDTMFEVKAQDGPADAGRAPNMKFRFNLDENTKIGELRLSDLFENDSRMLADMYSNSMAGYTALARKGVDFEARMKAITDHHEANNTKSAASRIEREMQLLQDAYYNITGRPMSTADFSASARLASTVRAYTRSTMLGQLGVTAAFEMKQAIALSSFRAVWGHSPSFRGLITSLRNGYQPDSTLSRNILAFAGFGHEGNMAYARAVEVHDFGMEQGLQVAETAANKVSHLTDTLSGNRAITALTRNWTAKAMVQNHVDLAHGRKGLSEKKRTRLVGQGVDRDMLDGVLADLKKHTVIDGNGIVKELDYEGWKAANPETHDAYKTMLSRETRDAIQDQDLGETMPFMHTTIGKIFSELRTFMMVGHAKNFLKNLSYKDATSLQVFLISYIGEAMGYALQTSMNFAHDPEKLAQKLDPEQVAKAAFFRSAALGVLPLFAGTGYSILTGQSLEPGTTGNTDNRSLLETPSIVTLKRLNNAPQTMLDAVVPGRTVTSKELRDLVAPLPLANTYGVRNAVDFFSSMQPKSEPQ